MKTYQLLKKATKEKIGPLFKEEEEMLYWLRDYIAIDCWPKYSVRVLTIEEFPIEICEEDRIVYYPVVG